MTRALDVEGLLTVESEGGPDFQLAFAHDSIIMTLSDERSARALLRQSPGRIWIKRLHRRLVESDLDLSVRVGTEPIGFLGPRARPGILSRLLGLAPLQVRWGAALRLWLARP